MKSKSEKEIWCEALCKLSGCCTFAGIFMESYALFTSTATGSTLALPIKEMSVKNIQHHVASNAKEFNHELVTA